MFTLQLFSQFFMQNISDTKIETCKIKATFFSWVGPWKVTKKIRVNWLKQAWKFTPVKISAIIVWIQYNVYCVQIHLYGQLYCILVYYIVYGMEICIAFSMSKINTNLILVKIMQTFTITLSFVSWLSVHGHAYF